MATGSWLQHETPNNRAGDLERRKQGLTTHLTLWPAAPRFAKWLEENSRAIGLDAPGAKILELGSGTGWLGCTLARNLSDAALVQLTEQPDAVQELRDYCNNFADQYSVKSLVVSPCDWADFMPPAQATISPQTMTQEGNAATNGWDFVLGSDLVWNRPTCRDLPYAVLAALRGGKPGCVAYYAHWQRNAWALPQVLEGLHGLGLDTEWVNRPPADLPESPESVKCEAEHDDNFDWTHVIFAEGEKEELPIFLIYKIWLANSENSGS